MSFDPLPGSLCVSANSPATGVYAPPPISTGRLVLAAGERATLGKGALTEGVDVKLLADSPGRVWLGSANESLGDGPGGAGFELSPGEEIFLPVADLHDVSVLADRAGGVICWLAI